jgi:hypothetical protein
MMSTVPAPSSSWRRRVRELLSFLLRPSVRDRRPSMAWADMQPIDFEGEDGSLTERDLRLMK